MKKKAFPKFGNGKGMKKIHSHNSGNGIRGFHSWEWTGTGIPAHPWLNVMFHSMTRTPLTWQRIQNNGKVGIDDQST